MYHYAENRALSRGLAEMHGNMKHGYLGALSGLGGVNPEHATPSPAVLAGSGSMDPASQHAQLWASTGTLHDVGKARHVLDNGFNNRISMFSPPVGGASGGGAGMKGGPPNVDSSQLYHQGYKPPVSPDRRVLKIETNPAGLVFLTPCPPPLIGSYNLRPLAARVPNY
ncbi:hypothetical protein BaRGS_00031870, partial [Batillaria attramentaria]